MFASRGGGGGGVRPDAAAGQAESIAAGGSWLRNVPVVPFAGAGKGQPLPASERLGRARPGASLECSGAARRAGACFGEPSRPSVTPLPLTRLWLARHSPAGKTRLFIQDVC